MARNVDKDPILDGSDAVWWAALGVMAAAPIIIMEMIGWPWWTGLIFALALAPVSTPLRRRYERSLRSRSPSKDDYND